ncbi:MAG: hypothetical protein M3376_02165 [Actinomycetota bacterium]|nr:hypothetical protein [Actinomycetota bacterium]
MAHRSQTAFGLELAALWRTTFSDGAVPAAGLPVLIQTPVPAHDRRLAEAM